jgi:hypothetical protein
MRDEAEAEEQHCVISQEEDFGMAGSSRGERFER